jgi:hypothetical protein
MSFGIRQDGRRGKIQIYSQRYSFPKQRLQHSLKLVLTMLFRFSNCGSATVRRLNASSCLVSAAPLSTAFAISKSSIIGGGLLLLSGRTTTSSNR